jgi:uncharacterized membrane protein
MKEWLVFLSEHAIVLIDFAAMIVIVVGTIEVLINATRVFLTPVSGHERREVWLRYASWLVAGLTLQLGADVIETAITTSWDAVGRIAAIAVIRTFLNYFLERDLAEMRDRQHETPKRSEVGHE